MTLRAMPMAIDVCISFIDAFADQSTDETTGCSARCCTECSGRKPACSDDRAQAWYGEQKMIASAPK